MFIIRLQSRQHCSSISRTHLLLSLTYVLFNLLLVFKQIECLQTSASQQQRQGSDTGGNSSSDVTSLLLNFNSNNNNNSNSSGNNSSDVTLLSSEEYVDAKEVPAILIDGLSNETSSSTDGDDAAANSTATPDVVNSKSATVTPNKNSSDDGPNLTSPSQLEVVTRQDLEIRNSSINSPAPPPPPAVTTIAPEIVATEKSIKPVSSGNESAPISGDAPNVSGENDNNDEEDTDSDDADGEYGDANSDTTKETNQNQNDYNKNNLTFEPPQNISQYMDYIERLFHDLRHQITDLFEPHIPQLIRTSQMVELSNPCSYDMLRMALALRQFEPWALRMIDSSGKMPEGIFEGSFTALGSYDECINTVFESSSSQTTSSGPPSSPSSSTNSNQADTKHVPTQGKYCLVTVSPFMPPKPPADKVERLFQDEANRRNYTKDDQFSRLSPMFYYMKFRIGVCIPSTCNQEDMDSISGTLSSSLRLNITIPDCRVRQTNVPLTRAQFTGGLVFACVVALVLCATLADCFRVKLKRIHSQEMKLKRQVAANQHGRSAGLAMVTCSGKSNNVEIRMRPPLASLLDQQSAKFINGNCNGDTGQQAKATSNFEQELNKNWSWMSFSLLTNFRLYFQQNKPSSSPMNSDLDPRGQSGNAADSHEIRIRGMPTSQTDCSKSKAKTQISTINCLNGIRVLSLCWVILANSYLTLDPRATKRLSKSREAPRDFFFQIVVQASLAIETFFFLSGLLMSLSFAKRLKPSGNGNNNNNDNHNQRSSSTILRWALFYVHRYIRMTPPTMLVIAFSMFAYHYGDGPLWFEATQRVHQSCAQNWWRHLLHVANFIDTRQMCFIHYWYIAADMQLFLFAPLIMLLLYKCRHLGYAVIALIGSISIGLVFYKTYDRSLPPTLLFYNTDPESRREFGNTIMTKPYTHVLPYLVGMLVGWSLLNSKTSTNPVARVGRGESTKLSIERDGGAKISLTGLGGLVAVVVALGELFLPYKWNNSHLPSKLMASTYAALFRFGWSLVLAYIVLTCRHKRGSRCTKNTTSTSTNLRIPSPATKPVNSSCCEHCTIGRRPGIHDSPMGENHFDTGTAVNDEYCFCGSGGNLINRLLSLNIFAHLSKLSFVAYLIHLPLMSVFIGQTRGLFAFSHTLVIHFAISYLVMTFVLSFVLVHIIEFPFITFERLMFDKLLTKLTDNKPLKQTFECDGKTLSTEMKHHGQNSEDIRLGSGQPGYMMAQQAQNGLGVRKDLYSNVTFGIDAGGGNNNSGANNRCQKRLNMLHQADLSDISERL